VLKWCLNSKTLADKDSKEKGFSGFAYPRLSDASKSKHHSGLSGRQVFVNGNDPNEDGLHEQTNYKISFT
jgi:hypothetical protein